jgi:chromatin structure-remodeling complex subunit RSC9
VTMHHERYHAQQDDQGEATGLGFLACLVLRNVARTVRVAIGNPAGGASINSLAEGEMSIFEAIEAASEGTEQKDGVAARLEKIDFAEAKSGAEALMGLEIKLMRTTVEDHGLGKILGEVLEVVTACRVAMAMRERAERGEVVEDSDEVAVPMEA